jgi:murein DD-endopeptidase MepM/ murein hydrolase activator NlpD
MRWVVVVLLAACSGEEPARDGYADGFDFPVGAPDGVGYYDAQRFGENAHLGSDWNGVRGGDSDRGDAVHVVADGVVTFAGDAGDGWGNVVRVEHRTRGGAVESLYAHLGQIDVAEGDRLRRGEMLGTIGDAGGRYLPHLHFEIRVTIGRPIGGGYGTPDGQVDPTRFIEEHRPLRRSRAREHPVPDA